MAHVKRPRLEQSSDREHVKRPRLEQSSDRNAVKIITSYHTALHTFLETKYPEAISEHIKTLQTKLEAFDDSGITSEQENIIAPLMFSVRKLAIVVGEAGTGKTFIQSTLMKRCKQKNMPIKRLGPTHACLQNMKGSQTFQFFFGLVDKKFLDISLAKVYVDEVVHKIRRHKFIQQGVIKPGISTIIIDEAFMIPAQLIDIVLHALEQIAPGKFRVLLFFDPMQLGPVSDDKNPTKPEIILHSKFMKDADVFVLTTNMRQSQEEKDFLFLLRHVARGEVDDEIYTMLKSRIPPKKDSVKYDIHICATNETVHQLNKKHLEELGTPCYTFTALDKDNVHGAKLAASVSWAVGAKIIFDSSLNDVGLYNGMTGTIIATVKTNTDLILPVIKIDVYDNMQIVVHPHTEIITNDKGDVTKGVRVQFPFAIAYAITVHKVQGKTIFGNVLVHLENMYTEGQMYTSMSRVTKLSHLWLQNLPNPRPGYDGLYNLHVNEESIAWARQVGMITA